MREARVTSDDTVAAERVSDVFAGGGTDLQAYEDAYMRESAKTCPSQHAKFNYAWALLRSRRRRAIKKGVLLLEGLLEDDYNERQCLFFMAVGHIRQLNYERARLCLQQLLSVYPDFHRASSLLDLADDALRRQQSASSVTLLGASLFAALSVGVGYYLLKRQR